jgi:hypothetical protein
MRHARLLDKLTEIQNQYHEAIASMNAGQEPLIGGYTPSTGLPFLSIWPCNRRIVLDSDQACC